MTTGGIGSYRLALAYLRVLVSR